MADARLTFDVCLPHIPPMPEDLLAVAMSGGVDSSVVAAMMSRAGRKVAGFTMQLWNQRRLPEICRPKLRQAVAARSMTFTMRVRWRSNSGFLITSSISSSGSKSR